MLEIVLDIDRSIGTEVVAKICLTSRHVRFGFFSNINATTPATSGAAEEVPLKPAVELQFGLSG